MTAVELEWFAALLVGTCAVARVEHFARECLDRGSRQDSGEFCQMCTTIDAGKALLDPIAESLEEIQAHQLSVSVADGIAMIRVWNRVGDGFCIDDAQFGVDSDAEPEVVYRLSCRPDAGSERGITGLYICYMRIDIPQTVVA